MTYPLNQKRRRKITKLQTWRAQYHYIVKTIRTLKRDGDHVWGTFKRPRKQSLHAAMRLAAQQHMKDRKIIAAQAALEWAAQDALRKTAIAAPVAKTEY